MFMSDTCVRIGQAGFVQDGVSIGGGCGVFGFWEFFEVGIGRSKVFVMGFFSGLGGCRYSSRLVSCCCCRVLVVEDFWGQVFVVVIRQVWFFFRLFVGRRQGLVSFIFFFEGEFVRSFFFSQFVCVFGGDFEVVLGLYVQLL